MDALMMTNFKPKIYFYLEIKIPNSVKRIEKMIKNNILFLKILSF